MKLLPNTIRLWSALLLLLLLRSGVGNSDTANSPEARLALVEAEIAKLEAAKVRLDTKSYELKERLRAVQTRIKARRTETQTNIKLRATEVKCEAFAAQRVLEVGEGREEYRWSRQRVLAATKKNPKTNNNSNNNNSNNNNSNNNNNNNNNNAENNIDRKPSNWGRTDDHPWWMVDLGKNYPISAVAVTARGDCCANMLKDFYIDVFKQDPRRHGSAQGERCAFHNGSMAVGATETLLCPMPIVGRYVRVKKDTRMLSLCEVEVYSP
nr:hypothetical protein BaRGS_033617 [Batillaria attramentaria]